MTTPRSVSLALLVSAALTTPAALDAQVVSQQSNADITHAHGAPFWTDNVPEPTSLYGQVDQCDYVWWFGVNSAPQTLQPGHYVAQFRVRKIVNSSGAYDLTIAVDGPGITSEAVLPAADQTVGEWIWTPEVPFTVVAANSDVTVAMRNTDSVLKRGYQVDAFRLGRIPYGSVLASESLGTWEHAHGGNPGFWTYGEPDTDAVYGEASKLNVVWWLALNSGPRTLPAGIYSASARIKKTNSNQNAGDLELSATFNGQTVTSVLPAGNQPVDQYVYITELGFVLPQATDVEFSIRDTNSTPKSDYHFDSFVLRRNPNGQLFGNGCGGVTMQATGGARIAQSLDFEIVNRPPTTVLSVMLTGVTEQALPLDPIGMTGCSLLVDPVITTPVNLGGIPAVATLVLPPDQTLIGQSLAHQGVVAELVPSVNPLGVATTNGVRTQVGN